MIRRFYQILWATLCTAIVYGFAYEYLDIVFTTFEITLSIAIIILLLHIDDLKSTINMQEQILDNQRKQTAQDDKNYIRVKRKNEQ